ncbi:hypothetical protein [Vallitalea maricola]|uniref:Uncharacterized protein n=1 Tax=Vallitalea maricola TaxID=3074433 RepID=A0ACB5UFD2_9FIRM|nr:hypothetical protein AN2V17_07910 [Vallitalea sp. AN17-2]
MKYLQNFLSLGKMTVSNVIHKIFYIGALIVAYKSFMFARVIYITCTYEKMVRHIEGRNTYSYTSTTVNNAPLAVLGFIIYFIVILILWKLICELLLKFFTYFELQDKDY